MAQWPLGDDFDALPESQVVDVRPAVSPRACLYIDVRDTSGLTRGCLCVEMCTTAHCDVSRHRARLRPMLRPENGRIKWTNFGVCIVRLEHYVYRAP